MAKRDLVRALVLLGVGCSSKGLLVLDVVSGAKVPALEFIDVTAGRTERFVPAPDRKPALYVAPGTYEVTAQGWSAGQVVASGTLPEPVVVGSGDTVNRTLTLLAASPPTGDRDGGGRDGADDPSPLSPDQRSDATDGPVAPDKEAPMRNPACGTAAADDLKTVFSETFEAYPTGAVDVASGMRWTRAMSSRDASVTETWAYQGNRTVVLASFTTSTEIIYARLPTRALPARMTLELVYTPDGFYVYHDYATVGLATAPSKFELQPRLALRAVDHKMVFQANPAAPVANAPLDGTQVFNELEYGRDGSTPLVHNLIRLELDFCRDEATISIGKAPDAMMRAKVPFDGTREVDSVFLAGGLNPTYIDDIVVSASGL